MSKFWQAQRFKDLQAEWYQKLSHAGFEDIEETGGQLLKQYASNACRGSEAIPRQNKAAYYQLISSRAQEEKYDNEEDALIMQLTADGYLISEILQELRSRGTPRSPCTVRFIRRRYEHKWKIRQWSLKQMRLKK